MPRLFHRILPAAAGQKVFLATPAYGPVVAGFAYALAATTAALARKGIVAEVALYAGDCHVDDARNTLVSQFLQGDCTDLVFLDSDLRWEPEALLRLLAYDRDVVAGTYPFKGNEGFPVRYLPGELWSEHDGLLEVAGVPTGFLRIRRSVLERLAAEAPTFKSKSPERPPVPLIFERLVHNGCRIGGDYAFCHKWRALGGKIYLDPEIEFDHFGEQFWSGSVGHHLRVEIDGPIKGGLKEIRQGASLPRTFQDMAAAWGNLWACDAAMLNAITLLAAEAKGPIIEAGSGLSSLCMAAATRQPVIALEHDSAWARRMQDQAAKHGLGNLEVRLAPLQDGWYSQVPPGPFAMAVCDGPPRKLSDRSGFFALPLEGAVVVADDADCTTHLEPLRQWAARSGRTLTILGNARKFAVSKPRMD
jgi:hypothetical protein